MTVRAELVEAAMGIVLRSHQKQPPEDQILRGFDKLSPNGVLDTVV